jgi:hypothetical protein
LVLAAPQSDESVVLQPQTKDPRDRVGDRDDLIGVDASESLLDFSLSEVGCDERSGFRSVRLTARPGSEPEVTFKNSSHFSSGDSCRP